MNHTVFPSKLTQVVVKSKEKKHTVTLPQKELFRVTNIFSKHEYQIPPGLLPSHEITVVDIGANVGLFALYMTLTQSVRALHCFEPAPATVELLRRNVSGVGTIHIHPFGLSDREGTASLMLHPSNTGANSLVMMRSENPEAVDVAVRDAASALTRLGLDYIDVLKIDTEGCEVPILQSLLPRLGYIGIILLEYHSEEDRRSIDQLLAGFKLFGAQAAMMDVGTLKFINRRLL